MLSAAYYESCPNLDLWNVISQQGYVLLSPLCVTQERIKAFLPDEPLPEPSKGTSHEASKAVEVSTIAFLKKEDIGLIDTVRKSKSRAIPFLQFLLKVVLVEDSQAFEKIETSCECGLKHNYYRAAWSIPLSQRKWIPVGDSKAVAPNAESLTALLAEREDLVKLLREGKPAELMQIIGMSIGDLLLRFVANDEKSRITLISSVTDLYKAAGSDTEKFRAIAEEIKNNPGIIQELEDVNRSGKESSKIDRQVSS